MANFITDGNFDLAEAISDFRFSAPFVQYGVNTLYVVEQDFVINRNSFSPLAIDTPHPTLSGYFLAAETPMQPVALADTVRWTRRYSQVPSTFSHAGGTYPYTFPVMWTGLNDTSRLFPQNITVSSRVQVDFFHSIDSDSVPVIEPQRYVIATSPNTDATSPWGQPVVTNAGFGVTPTIPDLATYQSWIAGGVELVPEASKITPNWMGYIHMRETIYIKAH